MTTSTEHRLVREYLSKFDRAAGGLPRARRAELREEIAAHLRDSIPADLPDGAAAMVIADFGPPEEIVGQEPMRDVRRDRRPVIVIGAVAVIAVAILIAAIALRPEPITSKVNAHPEGPERVTTGIAYAEYKAEIASLEPLPRGATYPIGIPTGLDSGPVDPALAENGVMGSGGGRWIARMTWLCAWELEYFTAFKAEDLDRRVAAEAALDRYGKADYADPVWAEAVLGPMHFGDIRGVGNDVRVSCASAYIFNVLG